VSEEEIRVSNMDKKHYHMYLISRLYHDTPKAELIHITSQPLTFASPNCNLYKTPNRRDQWKLSSNIWSWLRNM